MTRPVIRPMPADPRPSLFQAGAAVRYAAALVLSLLLWAAILWACR